MENPSNIEARNDEAITSAMISLYGLSSLKMKSFLVLLRMPNILTTYHN